MKVNAAMIQMDVCLGDPVANRAKVKSLTTGLGQQHIILLPELWTTAYDLKNAEALAEDIHGASVATMQELAKRHGSFVGGSLLLREETGIYNTFVLVSPSGDPVATYSKAHLFQLMDEHVYLTPGNKLSTFRTEFGVVGLAICYDLRFPELFRFFADQGVEIVFLVAQWPLPRLNHWCTLNTARAIENQCFFLACNRVGQDRNNTFFGNSLILDPWGEILVEGDSKERIITAQLNMSRLEETRTTLPVLTDRRRDLF